jgi:hypothetical protein
MKLLNYYSNSIGEHNIKAILQVRIANMEGNIYECFNFP